MKTIKLIKTTLLFISLGIFTVSCSDFLDVNDNPNDPAISTPSLTLPVAQQYFAALNAREMTYLGQMMVANWATPSNWSANENYFRFNITTDFHTTAFETPYGFIFRDLTYIENYEDPTGAKDYSTYVAISQTIKAFQYQYLVDLYGDVPYTEANLRGANTTPVYDDAEFVYKSNIDALTNAAILALDVPANAEDPASQDIIFGGDMMKWAKFANTIKLRYLVRLGESQTAYIKEEIAKINANGAGFITADVVSNPGYADSADKQNPFYGYFRNPTTDAQTDRNDYTVACNFALDFLEARNDDRLERIYADSENHGYKGVEQNTILPGEDFTSKDLSKVGPGLLTSNEQDQPIMLYSEFLFLHAEAVQRGYMASGDAEMLYNQAIEESFIYLGVEDAVAKAQAYYAQELPNVAWGFSPNKIEAIITQKWIALNGTSSIESWIEHTRTGFPSNIPIPVDAVSKPGRPVSLLYPDTEVARNSDNVPAQTPADAFTNFPFWK